MYVIIRSEPGLYTVGFYAPDGEWHPLDDCTKSEAIDLVNYLNGGNGIRPRISHEGDLKYA